MEWTVELAINSSSVAVAGTGDLLLLQAAQLRIGLAYLWF
jgi:hypothetical protein